MKDALYTWIFFGLPIWWIAQALLGLRDYFYRRHTLRQMPPPTQEEVEAIASIRSGWPRKEKKSLRWYLDHPKEGITHWWWFVPVMIFFWPLVLLSWALPPLESRLSPEMLQRFRSEGV